jgi:hypothetical protein
MATAVLLALVPAGCSDGAAPPAQDSAPQDGRAADGEVTPQEWGPTDSSGGDGESSDAAGPPACTAPTNRGLRVFFIGNSFTLGGPIPTLVGALASAAGFPKPDIQYSAVGGYSLAQHRNLSASVSGVATGGWDHVVLQEYSTKPTDKIGDPAGFKADATWFYDKTKATSPAGWVILYETWARHPDHGFYPGTFTSPAQMQSQLRKHYNDAAKSYIPQNAAAKVKDQVKVAPAGDAWEKHLSGANPLRLHASDNYHAGNKGQYLNALVIFSTIYGCKASGLSSLGLSSADAARLQLDADATTGVKGVPPPGAVKKMSVGAKVKIDLGTTQTTAPGWNNVLSVSGSLTDAQTSTGQPTSVDVAITDAFSGTNGVGVAANALGWPATVSMDTLWAGSFSGHSAALAAPAQLELRDLPVGSYTLEVFASRTGKDGNMDRLGRYTVGGGTWKDLDAADNTSQKAVFANQTVDSGGKLILDVAVSPAGTARFAYLGALVLTRVK